MCVCVCVCIGYVQSLIRRVVNNVNIVVNNLILKYVEDDIVLSVNITSAECYTVDDAWERAFMDITGEGSDQSQTSFPSPTSTINQNLRCEER